MEGPWQAEMLGKLAQNEALAERAGGLQALAKALAEQDLQAVLVQPEAAALALDTALREIAAAVPDDELVATYIKDLAQTTRDAWCKSWEEAERALDPLLLSVHAYLYFCADPSARAHLDAAVAILDELAWVASDGAVGQLAAT